MRVLIVDDSTLYRRCVRSALSNVSNVEVVGEAENGTIALEQIDSLQPDLITLDLRMPKEDGFAVLQALKDRGHGPAVIVLTADKTVTSARLASYAIRLGAFDFVIKPDSNGRKGTVLPELEYELRRRIDAIAHNLNADRSGPPTSHADRATKLNDSDVRPSSESRIAVIGASTGGPEALAKVLPQLPANFAVPVLVVQHMPEVFTKCLADDLDAISALEVREAADFDAVKPGHAYLAPGGKQMRVERKRGKHIIRITDDEPENHVRPSVDYTLRSVAPLYGQSAMAVVLTGMGNDGTAGCRSVHQQGGTVVTQEEADCVVYGMPKSVVDAGLSDISCPLTTIANELTDFSLGKAVTCHA